MNETDCLFTIDGRKKEDICHYGIKGQKWGERHYQNKDGSLTPAGRQRYSKSGNKTSKASSSSSNRSGLKKRIPGLKRDRIENQNCLSVTKNGSKLRLLDSATDVSDKDFENTYKNLDKLKKQITSQLKKYNTATGKISPEAFDKTSDFNITIFNKKNAVCGVYVHGTGKSQYVHGEFDLYTDKDPLQFD